MIIFWGLCHNRRGLAGKYPVLPKRDRRGDSFIKPAIGLNELSPHNVFGVFAYSVTMVKTQSHGERGELSNTFG